MEVAIPIFVLGGLYLIQDKNTNNIEPMKNISNNTVKHIPEHNYNLQPSNDIKQPNNINYYPTDNQANKEYNLQSEWKLTHNQVKPPPLVNEKNSMSLTGENLNLDDFKHNNMQPFFGSKVTQLNVDNQATEGILDNLQGGGSQFVHKKEQAPLFNPQDNNQWTHGMPCTTDFMQDRVNPGMYMSNVKPFEEEMVGPGLDKGYTTEGSGGFNSGMDAREKWIAKSVDDLRVKTNPKQTFEGRTLNGGTSVSNRGSMGKFEQHRPDKFFANGPERYLTTTGLEKGQTLRSIQELTTENRDECNAEYYGIQGNNDVQATYTKGNYEKSTKQQLGSQPVTNAYIKTGHGDYGASGYKNVNTNRAETDIRTPQLGVASLLNAVVAPLMDVLKPSRKENTVFNTRVHGLAGNISGGSGHVKDMNNLARTTNRQTLNQQDTMGQAFNTSMAVSGNSTNPQQVINQQRDNTHVSYSGIGGSSFTSKQRHPGAEKNARTNPNKEQVSYIGNFERNGNISLLNSNINQNNRNDNGRINKRNMAPTTGMTLAPTKETSGGLSYNNLRDNQVNMSFNNHQQQLNNNPYHHSIN
jgi:hypothetical protein